MGLFGQMTCSATSETSLLHLSRNRTSTWKHTRFSPALICLGLRELWHAAE
jgi:hypothetical protein